MKFLLAKKVNMTQIFDEAGRTRRDSASVAPNKITQVKTWLEMATMQFKSE